MDHGHHEEGGGMDMIPGCTMRMLWNSDYKSTCIVHPAFQVHSGRSLVFYMVVLFGIGVGYEYLRRTPARLEYQLRLSESYKRSARNASDGSRSPLLTDNRAGTPLAFNVGGEFTFSQKVTRSLLYTSNVAVSFFLMLVIMTYNTYLIGAVLAGAFTGHFLFHDQPVLELDRRMACH